MAGTFTNLLYHIVFSTKDRQPLITPDLQPSLYPYIGGILRAEGGTLLEIGGVSDHIHLLAISKPDLSIADLVRTIKANASRWINERPGPNARFEWQAGYGAFTVSESQIPAVTHYIRNQPDHHRTRTFQEEFLDFLRRHNLHFDERYIWK